MPTRIIRDPAPASEGATKGGASQIAGDVSNTSLVDNAANALKNITFARLFVVGSIAMYCVLAFSKKEAGISVYDIRIMIWYLFVVLGFFCLITLLRRLYYSEFLDLVSSAFGRYKFRHVVPLIIVLVLLIIYVITGSNTLGSFVRHLGR